MKIKKSNNDNYWSYKKLNQTFTSINDKSKQIKSSNYLSTGKYPIVDQGKEFICGFTNDDSKLITENLPLIVFGDHTRNTKYIDFPFAIGADGTQLIKAKQSYNDLYLYYLISYCSNLIGNYGYDRHFKHLKEFRTKITVSEYQQTEIAKILLTLDKTINLSLALIEKFKRIKKGLQNDLLSKGINKNGSIPNCLMYNFKESCLGNIPIDWEVISFGNNEYFQMATGGTPSTSRKEYWENGNIPWLSSGEIHKKIIKDSNNFITQKGYDNSNARYYPINSILIALAGQGKTRGTVAITEIELTSNQSIAAIISISKDINPYYIYYYLDSKYDELRAISSGSGRAGLSLRILKKVKIKLPKIEEQNAIVEKLKNMDDLIQKEIENYNKYFRLKSGLMHDLLTGKVRVKEEIINKLNN